MQFFRRIFLVIILVLNFGQVFSEQSQPAKKPVRVYVDMIADLFHPGHVSFFKKALKHGDVLVVGLISDEEATTYKRKPIMTLEERINAVESCKYVGEVIGNVPLILTEEFIKEHNINVVVHGDDYTQEQIEEMYGVPYKMGIYQPVPYTQGISTSDLIRRIAKRVLTGEFKA